jgi:hypothetical protein
MPADGSKIVVAVGMSALEITPEVLSADGDVDTDRR